MEQNKYIDFEIINNDDILIKDVIANYNKIYGTDFKIVKFIYNEVVFAKIKVSKYKLSDLFELEANLVDMFSLKDRKEK